MSKEILQLKNVVKQFQVGDTTINAVNDISFSIDQSEFVVILGSSGAGKTTLLNLLGGMDSVTSGDLIVDDVNIARLNKKQLTDYRRHQVGFIFQFYNLMPNLNALENVELAVEMCKDAFEPAVILDKVGLGERMMNFPSQLSGGEQQRVSIARALAKNPQLLLCDEPTGALDYETGKSILALLQNMCKEEQKTVIVVTHNVALKEMADKVIYIKNGKITSIITNASPMPVDDIEW